MNTKIVALFCFIFQVSEIVKSSEQLNVNEIENDSALTVKINRKVFCLTKYMSLCIKCVLPMQ